MQKVQTTDSRCKPNQDLCAYCNAHPRDIINVASKAVLKLMDLDREEPTLSFNKNDKSQTSTETHVMFRDSSP